MILVAAALLVERDAVSVTLVIFGAGALVLGVLLRIVEGRVKIAPTGIEFTIIETTRRLAEQRAAELELPPERARLLFEAAKDELRRVLTEATEVVVSSPPASARAPATNNAVVVEENVTATTTAVHVIAERAVANSAIPALFGPDIDPLALEEIVSRLPDQEQEVFRLRFFGPATLEEIGRKMNLSRESVREIERRAVKRISNEVERSRPEA